MGRRKYDLGHWGIDCGNRRMIDSLEMLYHPRMPPGRIEPGKNCPFLLAVKLPMTIRLDFRELDRGKLIGIPTIGENGTVPQVSMDVGLENRGEWEQDQPKRHSEQQGDAQSIGIVGLQKTNHHKNSDQIEGISRNEPAKEIGYLDLLVRLPGIDGNDPQNPLEGQENAFDEIFRCIRHDHLVDGNAVPPEATHRDADSQQEQRTVAERMGSARPPHT